MDATVTVTAVTAVGPETVAIEFESPAGFRAQPGQFIKLLATVDGEDYARFYTLSSPAVAETFEITVEIDPAESGPFSEHLAALTAGDEIDMSGPFGAEYYEAEPRVVVLAGGPGVGPAVGIGERAIADDNAVHIVYRATEPVHETRLSALDAAGGTVTITDADGFPAAVDEAVTAAADEQVFVYGFDAFVTAATDAIAAAGGDPDAAKVENFG
jgi:cytochrome-b5 reductase